MSAADVPAAVPAAESRLPPWLADAQRLDVAVYDAIARTPTPSLDRAMSAISRAADHSKLNLASAAVLSLAGGPEGRRAAATGLTSVAVTATIVNALLKPLGRRRRPDRVARAMSTARQVPMPRSRSLPSGHAAAAFAFATGVGAVTPTAAAPIRLLAAVVAYSRVHVGVHYPADVIAGALLGSVLASATAHQLEERRR